MESTFFKQAYERTLGAGDNPNTGDLPYVVARDPNTPGPVVLVSCWRLSEAELREVLRTGKIYVAVMAHPEYRTQPPISLHGCNPFEYENGNAYQVAPRTYQEEQVERIAAEAKEIILKRLEQAGDEGQVEEDRSGLLQASGLKGVDDDFEIEKTEKDFKVIKPRIGKHEEEG